MSVPSIINMDEHGFGDRIWRLERLLEDLPAKETVEGEESLESTALYNRLYNLQDALDNCLADDMALRTFIERCRYFLQGFKAEDT